MSGLGAMLLCMCSFWLGFAYRQIGIKRRDNDGLRDFAEQIVSSMEQVKKTRRMTGKGVLIQRRGEFRHRDHGVFKVTIEDL